MKKTTLSAVAALSLMAAPAFAQAPASPAAAAPSARALELSHRLIVAMHVNDSFAAMMRALIPQMVDLQARRIPGFKPEWRQPLIEATQEAAGDDLMPALMKRAEPIYAQTFTEDELAQAVAFYESPVGQSIIRKSPSITPRLVGDLQTLAMAMGADVQARFCKKIGGCDKSMTSPNKPASS